MINRNNKNRKIIAFLLVVIFMMASFSILLVSCNSAIKFEAQPSLITEPVYFDKSKGEYVLLNEGDPQKAHHPIDFEKDDKKQIIESAWKNIYFAPFMLTRQSGDVVTFSAGTKVIQSVSTYRMAMRSNKVDHADDGEPGLAQEINYLQSNSVTSQGIPGIDIRLMIEVLRQKSGTYLYRQATDKTNIKLDPTTSEFYNMTGRWETKRANNLSLFNQIAAKDNPNKIITYDVKVDSIDSVKEIDFATYKTGDQEYDRLRDQVKNKQIPDIHVYKIKFNKNAWEGTYIAIMYDMLHLGGQAGQIQYLNLDMTMEVWGNGYIRQLNFTEKYDIDLGSLKANAQLDSNIQISYKEKQILKEGEPEVNWPRKFLHRFKKRFKDDRKPGANVDKSKLK